MAPISLADELTIEPNDSGFDFSSDDPNLPSGEDNLWSGQRVRFRRG